MAFDAFLKIEGIDGESTDEKHKGEIDVLSFNWGATNRGLALGQGVERHGKTQIQDLSFVKKIDKTTPQLIQSAAKGSHFPNATLTVRKAGGNQQDYIKVTLEDVIVTSMSAGGNTSTDELPVEQISINFSKVEFSVLGSPNGT